MENTVTSKPSIYYPPGGMLIWIVISIEMLTFLMGIAAFLVSRNAELSLFNESQLMLNKTFGTINTIVLITSGYLVAEAVKKLAKGQSDKSYKYMLWAIVVGSLFLVLKAIEYNGKINLGIALEENTFFTFYWLLTGFHFVHVLVGVVILSILMIQIKKGNYTSNDYTDVETGASFWHMCDLIWLILFPVLYLI